MDHQTLTQLGDLLLGSVPTAVILLFLYATYHFLVHKPLQRVLEERRSRTQGAVERARADVAAAEAKSREYEERLREAKMAVYRSAELRRRTLQESRAAAVAEARAKANTQVEAAKSGIAREVAIAKQQLQAETQKLADAIIQAILTPAGQTVPAAGRQS